MNRFVFPLAEPQLIHHVVVFLLGTVPLDPAYGVSVYLCWANPEPCWKYLGYLSNDKPSAIFKINFAKTVSDPGANPFGLPLPAAAAGDGAGFGGVGSAGAGAGAGALGFASPAVSAQIGLSIEPLAAIAHQAAPEARPGAPAADPAAAAAASAVFPMVRSRVCVCVCVCVWR